MFLISYKKLTFIRRSQVAFDKKREYLLVKYLSLLSRILLCILVNRLQSSQSQISFAAANFSGIVFVLFAGALVGACPKRSHMSPLCAYRRAAISGD